MRMDSLLLRNGPESKHVSATTRENISNSKDETCSVRAERFKEGQASGKRQKSAGEVSYVDSCYDRHVGSSGTQR
jgi:hypothetical protein